jgi:rhodanese-related sulfurtransferase
MNHSPSNPSNPNITAAELHERLTSGEQLQILDVREPIEFHTRNIGGENIPLGKLSQEPDDLPFEEGDEIILICQAGLRSRTAQQILQQNGYTHTRNLTGGLLALRKLGV